MSSSRLTSTTHPSSPVGKDTKMSGKKLPLRFACLHYEVPAGSDPSVYPGSPNSLLRRVLRREKELISGRDFEASNNYCESCYANQLKDEEKRIYHEFLDKNRTPGSSPASSIASPRKSTAEDLNKMTASLNLRGEDSASVKARLTRNRNKLTKELPTSPTPKVGITHTQSNELQQKPTDLLPSLDWEYGDEGQTRANIRLEQQIPTSLTPGRSLDTSSGVTLPGLEIHDRKMSADKPSEGTVSPDLIRGGTRMSSRSKTLKSQTKGRRRSRDRSSGSLGVDKCPRCSRPPSVRLTTTQAREANESRYMETALQQSLAAAKVSGIEQKLHLHSEQERCARCDEARRRGTTSMSEHEKVDSLSLDSTDMESSNISFETAESVMMTPIQKGSVKLVDMSKPKNTRGLLKPIVSF